MDECSDILIVQKKELNRYIKLQTPYLAITPDDTLPQNNSSSEVDEDLQKLTQEVKGLWKKFDSKDF